MDPAQIIISRVLREIQDRPTLALGKGLPQLIKPHLPESVQVVDVEPGTPPPRSCWWSRLPFPRRVTCPVPGEQPKADQWIPPSSVDVLVVEAAEVSQEGDLAPVPGEEISDLKADQWIVATLHTREDGAAKIVQTCQLPVACSRCVSTIITELGVMKINQVGLVIEEIAPGISTDDVKSQTAASIHVADDIKVMEL